MRITLRLLWVAAAMWVAVSSPSYAADPGACPNRPIHIIISYPAGTATDTLARLAGMKLEEIRAEVARWGPVLRHAHVRVD